MRRPLLSSRAPGLGVAVDLGTTTLVTQLLDLRTGRVLAVRTALNSQARFGADVMSRVQFAVAKDGAATAPRSDSPADRKLDRAIGVCRAGSGRGNHGCGGGG